MQPRMSSCQHRETSQHSTAFPKARHQLELETLRNQPYRARPNQQVRACNPHTAIIPAIIEMTAPKTRCVTLPEPLSADLTRFERVLAPYAGNYRRNSS